MGLYEDVQLELFEFLGIKKPQPRATESITRDVLPWPHEIHRKAYKRGLSFKVQMNGVLRIQAPKGVSEKDVAQELLKYRDWIETQIKKTEKLRSQYPQKIWKAGELFPFTGKEYELELNETLTKKPWIAFKENKLEFYQPNSWLELPDEERLEKLNGFLKKTYKEKATKYLSDRTRHWSEQTQLFPKNLTFRDAKTIWGSCSSQGKISLNWKIIIFEPQAIDYVIVHELCHLVYQNHSKRFWNLVESHFPERKKWSAYLGTKAYNVDFLSKKSELYRLNPTLECSVTE